MLHTAGLGFLIGVDIYDCVLVINNRKALESFTKLRATVGGEISAVAGPVGVGGVLENDGKWKEANRPVFTYLKSRGFYAGVQVDGTIVIERTDENEAFYGEPIGVSDILAGKARHPPPEIRVLMETLKAAEGREDVDAEVLRDLDGVPDPGDVSVDAPGDAKLFGVPEPDDSDPFGVRALEMEGLEIREAGTHSRPSSEQFEFHPSPSSPIYKAYHRRSLDTGGTRSHRESYMSSAGRSRTMSDAATQTGEETIPARSSSTSPTTGQDKTSPYTAPSRDNDGKLSDSPITTILTPEDDDNQSPPSYSAWDSIALDDDQKQRPQQSSETVSVPRSQVDSTPAATENIVRGPPPPLPPRNVV
jgi:hypothetical protein